MSSRPSTVIASAFQARQATSVTVTATGGENSLDYSGSVTFGALAGPTTVNVFDGQGNSASHDVDPDDTSFHGTFYYDLADDQPVEVTAEVSGITETASATVTAPTAGGGGGGGGDDGTDGGTGGDDGTGGGGDGIAGVGDLWLLLLALLALGGGAIVLAR